MTDRELLKLAAIACEKLRGGWVDNEAYFDGVLTRWNPITDDGDALRLAVDLGMQIIPGENYVECVKVMRVLRGCRFIEMHKDDKHAATRRAIVRAAAEIGKTMENENE